MEPTKLNNYLLSSRESEIIIFISKGLSNKEIAQMLNLSVHTVITHAKNIYKKLNVNSRAEAAYEHMIRETK